MADKDLFEFGMSVNVDVEKSTLDTASKLLDGFYKKYNNKKMKVDTSEMVNAVQNGVSKIQDLYKRGLDQRNATGVAWWEGQDEELENTFNEQLSLMKKFLGEAKVIFKDNSVFSVLSDDITSVFTEKMSKGITVVAADLGERIDYLRERIKSSMDLFDAFGQLEYNQDGDISGFARDDMSEHKLKERVKLVRDLLQSQRELETLSGTSFDIYDSPSRLTTGDINDYLSNLNRMLAGLSAYNDQVDEENKLTTTLFKERQKILKQLYNDDDQWGQYTQSKAVNYASDEDEYLENIKTLKKFIEEREQLIETLRRKEDLLFNDGGVDEYIQEASEHIQRYKNYIDDINKARYGDNDKNEGNVNLKGIVNQLEEIRKAIVGIKEAFEPLTTALSSEDNAIHKMLTSSVEDLDVFKAKLAEVYQMIDTLSNKQFNVTNVMSSGSNTQNDLDQIRQFRKEARELFKQVEELYAEHAETANKIKSLPDGFEAILNFSAAMGDFDMADLAKRIKSRSAASLGIVIDELNEWKKVLLQFNSLRNNVEAGSFNVSKYSDTSSKVSIGSKTTDKDNKNIVDDRTVDDNDILNKIKNLSEQVEVELTSIREKIKETFNFDTLDLNIEKVKSMTDLIYQQFVELQSKINALNLNIDIPAISTGVKTDEKNIDAASDAMKEEGKSADEAVPKKNAFTQANKEAAQSAKETEDATKSAAEGIAAEANAIEQSAGKLVEASNTFDKIKYVDSVSEDGSRNPISKTTTSTDKRERAYETETTHYRYDEDLDQYVADAVTVVKDFKKRATELKKETAKIELAKKTVAKFLSQFDNKTAGHGSDIAGYNELKGFNIDSLDAIEEAMQKMIALDTKYNELTRDFRKGTKSMNPFVNAFNSMDEMRNKVKSVQLDFENLKSPTDALRKQVEGLPQLLDALNKALTPDENGAINIENIAKAYGNLNAAIKQVNSSIGLQRKEERINASNTKAEEQQIKTLHQLYEKQAKSAAKISEYRQKLNSGELGKEEARLIAAQLQQEKAQFASIQQQIRGYGDLYNSIEQVATITHELYMAELKMNAANEKQAQKTKQQEEKARNKQEIDDTEYLISLYKEYTAAALKLKKMQSDTTGKVHDSETATEIQNVQRAKQVLLDLGIDVNNITGSELLTEKQINALLEDRINYKKRLQQIEDSAADKTATKAQKEQQKQDKQNQKYGKTIYNRESRYSETIDAKASDLGKDISTDLSNKIQQYKTIFEKLKQLRSQFEKDPMAFESDSLKNEFQSTALEAEKLRKEILGIFKESEKLDQSSILGSIKLDDYQISNVRAEMLQFASAVSEGKFELESFSSSGDKMFGVIRQGNGEVQKVTVAFDQATGKLYAFNSGTKQVSNSWQQLGTSLKSGIKNIVGQYIGFHEALQAVRQGVEYVKEIDLAMTELKKVTNETDAAYEKFLGTASQVSSKIGSTVSDFTDATAAFARLGYSMDESTKMAETAIVYKNVAD